MTANTISIDYCNNIKHIDINIQKNKLNIKYGINGIGKTTISKALQYKINSPERLKELEPFDRTGNPNVTGAEKYKRVLVYNEEWIDNHLDFKNKDDITKNSFEVFIKPVNYDKKLLKINSILNKLIGFINKDEEINKIIEVKNILSKMVKVSKTKISETSPIIKAITEYNVLLNIPKNIQEFTEFLNNIEISYNWLEWHKRGHDNFNIYKKCPFCGQNLNNDFNNKSDYLHNIFNSDDVKTLHETDKYFNKIIDYFDDDTREFLHSFTRKKSKPDDVENKQLFSIMSEYNDICGKIEKLKSLDFSELKKMNQLKLDLFNLTIPTKLVYLNGEKYNNLAQKINRKIVNILNKVNSLEKEVGKLKYDIKGKINKNSDSINKFFEMVGMKYVIGFEDDNRIILYPKNSDVSVTPKDHLSFGEKNSFALALFKHECLSNNKYDLIILDDPVSSFDVNKKYGVFYYLFKEDKCNCLKGKTVILFTHDFEQIINYYLLNKPSKPEYVVAKYIENDDDKLIERKISKNKINNILMIEKKCYRNTKINILNRLIHLRHHLELKGEKNKVEYNVISSLLDGNPNPTYSDRKTLIDDEKIKMAIKEIEKYLCIKNFDYNALFSIVSNFDSMKKIYVNTKNKYERMELFRIITKKHKIFPTYISAIKFIDEAFHIENTYTFQLDPYAYNTVPPYITKMCDEYIKSSNPDSSKSLIQEDLESSVTTML